ncbi:MAG TPA: hypothetical protein VGM90_06340 [Kofleriaceae bacterium]|jgi:hypothetical protein
MTDANHTLVRAALADGGAIDKLGGALWMVAPFAPLAYDVLRLHHAPPHLPAWIAAAALAIGPLAIYLPLRAHRIRRERAWIASIPGFDAESYWKRLASTSASSRVQLRIDLVDNSGAQFAERLKGRPELAEIYDRGTYLEVQSPSLENRSSFKTISTQRNGACHRWLRAVMPLLLGAGGASIRAITTER